MDPLQYTSLCFILTFYKAFMRNHIFMSILWLLLTMTSFFYHGNRDNKLYYWSDQIVIYMIFLLGILYVFKSNMTVSILSIISYISVIVIYVLELKVTNEKNVDKDENKHEVKYVDKYIDKYVDKSTQLHMIIHFISMITFFMIFHFTDTINIW